MCLRAIRSREKRPFPLSPSRNFISAPAINNDRTAGPRYRRLCIAVIFHGVTSDVETYLKPAIKSVFFINRCHRCVLGSGSGARWSGAQRGDATNRYERPRIIIIVAGRRSRENTRRFLLYIFFIYCFLIDPKRSSARSVNIHLYFRFSIEQKKNTYRDTYFF